MSCTLLWTQLEDLTKQYCVLSLSVRASGLKLHENYMQITFPFRAHTLQSIKSRALGLSPQQGHI